MEVILYNNENEMPCYLRKEKNWAWDILEQAKWDEWNFVPMAMPQSSKFHSHVTWNSHRHEYFIRARLLRETNEAAAKRVINENKMTSVSEYEAEMAEAEAQQAIWDMEEQSEEDAKTLMQAEVFEELNGELAKNDYSNIILPTPKLPEEYKSFVKLTPAERVKRKAMANKKYYKNKKSTDDPIPEQLEEYEPFVKQTPVEKAIKKTMANRKYYTANKSKNTTTDDNSISEEYKPFVKLTPAERAAKKALANKKYYAANKNKTKPKKSDDTHEIEICPICGGKHKATPIGRTNHKLSYQHTSKLLLLHAAEAIMNKKPNITTIADAEAYIANFIKSSEDKLNRRLTRAEIKNKYKRLAAQYSL
jgi:hypothetical protein